MDFSLNIIYLRLLWRDPRLTFDPLNGKITSVRMGDGRWEDLWTPDIFFRNEKRSSFHSIMTPNRLLKLNTTGHVWYSTKISTTLSCPMNLRKYPLDTQACPIMVESFGYTIDTMYFSWMDSPVIVDPGVELPQHTIDDKILYDCSQNYTLGAFPCLEIRFVLRRDIGYFLMRVYMPSCLIVVLSWVSFWIDTDKIAERVSVGLVIILTMTTWSTGIQGSLPRVSYIKAIDVWMSVCLTFVFASLVEVGVVSAMSRKKLEPSVPVSLSMQCTDVENRIQTDNGEVNQKEGLLKLMNFHRKSKAQRVDEICRMVFPLAFLLFNVGYWTLYTIRDQNLQTLV